MGGVETHLVRKGQASGTPVVMLHGLNGVAQDFTGVLVDRLSERYEVFIPERPGYGYSRRPDRTLSSLEAQTAWLDALMDQLGQREAILVGHSMGAALAARYALHHPDRVRGLVLVTPYLYPSRSIPRWLRVLSHLPGLRHLLVHVFWAPIGRPLARRFAKRSFGPEPMPDGYEQLWADFTLRPEQALTVVDEIAYLDEAVEELVTEYKRLKVPALVLAGGQDRMVDPQAQAHRLHEQAPNVWLRTVEGAGHALVWTRPESVIEAVDEIHHVSKRSQQGNGHRVP